MEEGLPVTIDAAEIRLIKVLGVGGGGCNAVNYMYKQGIKDVSFMVCNSDNMALEKMDVPSKFQIGPGLGAGGKPEVAKQYADESRERLKQELSDGTKMVFITAGMGGGTGTGASPVVAEVAQELDILTVGIVTIPFAFEGKRAIRKALRGIAQLAQHTDALLVINNERLKLLFPDFDLPNAFKKSDEVVCNAAKSIAEIITIPGYINTDFQDVYNTLKDGNVAIMNVGTASGENRITKAIEDALNSPLVNTTDVHGASRILLNFYCSTEHAVCMKELTEVQEFCNSIGDEVEIKWGASYDDSLGESVKVIIIATGYNVNDLPGIEEALQSDEKEAVVAQPTKTVDDAMKDLYGDAPEKKAENETKAEYIPNIGSDIEEESIVDLGEDEQTEKTSFTKRNSTSSAQGDEMDSIPSYLRRRGDTLR